MRTPEIQATLRAEGLDGWLFFDHHHRDPLAYRVLQFDAGPVVTRRWYYLVPAEGEPRALVHKIEAHVLDALPGDKVQYAGWQQQKEQLRALLSGCRSVAMQYSPECAVPYVSNVDAGTVDLVRGCGIEVRTSANLIQYFEARWSQEAYDSHKKAGARVDAIRRAAFERAASALRAGDRITEHEIAQFIRAMFSSHGLVTDHGPIVAVNANASDPHYEPSSHRTSEIRKGDLLLIDLWAKLDQPGAVYYDITWTGYCGPAVPDEMANVFDVVRGGRDAAVILVKSAAAAGQELRGYQVDDAARGHIRDRGFAEHFFHRTGHSIGENVHGNGANMDNYETHDERKIIPGTCFSVEPGIYLPAFGIRSEVNVYRGEDSAEVTGEIQDRVLPLLA
jgi:Xaa-Pro aminopeptidase